MSRRAPAWLMALLLLSISAADAAAATSADPTQQALQRCLNAPTGGSTAGQTECEGAAARDYDRRMNVAYAKLMRRLPRPAAARLLTAQRAWLAFRSVDEAARSAFYETRQGTMYVPMQAAASADVVRDRALQLEASLRVMTIDD